MVILQSTKLCKFIRYSYVNYILRARARACTHACTQDMLDFAFTMTTISRILK